MLSMITRRLNTACLTALICTFLIGVQIVVAQDPDPNVNTSPNPGGPCDGVQGGQAGGDCIGQDCTPPTGCDPTFITVEQYDEWGVGEPIKVNGFPTDPFSVCVDQEINLPTSGQDKDDRTPHEKRQPRIVSGCDCVADPGGEYDEVTGDTDHPSDNVTLTYSVSGVGAVDPETKKYKSTGPGTATITVTAENSSNSNAIDTPFAQSVQVTVIPKVSKIQYQAPDGEFHDVPSSGIYVPVGTTVTFKAIPKDTDAWPAGTAPTWSGLASGSSETASVQFTEPSTGMSDLKNVKASNCGGEVTAGAIVYPEDQATLELRFDDNESANLIAKITYKVWAPDVNNDYIADESGCTLLFRALADFVEPETSALIDKAEWSYQSGVSDVKEYVVAGGFSNTSGTDVSPAVSPIDVPSTGSSQGSLGTSSSRFKNETREIKIQSGSDYVIHQKARIESFCLNNPGGATKEHLTPACQTTRIKRPLMNSHIGENALRLRADGIPQVFSQPDQVRFMGAGQASTGTVALDVGKKLFDGATGVITVVQLAKAALGPTDDVAEVGPDPAKSRGWFLERLLPAQQPVAAAAVVGTYGKCYFMWIPDGNCNLWYWSKPKISVSYQASPHTTERNGIAVPTQTACIIAASDGAMTDNTGWETVFQNIFKTKSAPGNKSIKIRDLSRLYVGVIWGVTPEHNVTKRLYRISGSRDFFNIPVDPLGVLDYDDDFSAMFDVTYP